MGPSRPHRLDTPIQFVKGVGPRYAELFARKGVETVRDALYYLPRAYEDRRVVTPVASLEAGVHSVCVGEVKSSRFRRGRRGRNIAEIVIADESGFLTLQWFQAGPWITDALTIGTRVVVAGQMKAYGGKAVMVHPDFEVLDEDEETDSLHFGRIVGIYSETEGLTQKRIRRILDAAVAGYAADVDEVIPQAIVREGSLPGPAEAIAQAHQPPSSTDMRELAIMRSPGQRRLVFEEFFLLSLGLAIRRRSVARQPGITMDVPPGVVREILSGLPFRLTDAQRRCLKGRMGGHEETLAHEPDGAGRRGQRQDGRGARGRGGGRAGPVTRRPLWRPRRFSPTSTTGARVRSRGRWVSRPRF